MEQSSRRHCKLNFIEVISYSKLSYMTFQFIRKCTLVCVCLCSQGSTLIDLLKTFCMHVQPFQLYDKVEWLNNLVILPRPTLVRLFSHPTYRTLTYILPHSTTTFFVLYTGLFSHYHTLDCSAILLEAYIEAVSFRRIAINR